MYKILANTIFLGKDVHFLSDCHSTNDIAFQLVREGKAKEGSIVICENQTQGKGQRGNIWKVEPGKNLTFSLVLCPNFMDVSEQFFLNMAVSNGIRQVLSEYLPFIQIKWPNDFIVPGEGKIGGMLIENSYSGKGWEFAVVGVGLNINQLNFDILGPSSLRKITGSEFNLEEIFRLLITQIEQSYIALKKRKWAELKTEYLNHLFLFQEKAVFNHKNDSFSGKIVNVRPNGQLEMELENGENQYFDFKEIQFPVYHT